MIQELITGGQSKNGTKIYTITAVAIRPAYRSHRNDLAVYTAVGRGTGNDPGFYPGKSEKENKNLDETGLSKVLEDSDGKVNPDVKEFIDLMRKLVGTLIAQSCEMAALVYQNYYIEKNLRKKYRKSFM